MYKGLHANTVRIVAIKEIPIFDASKRHQLQRELLSLYGNLQPIHDSTANLTPAACPHLITLHDAFMQPDRGVLSLVLEYMDGGSLQDIVDTGGCAEESVLSHIAKDVLLGLHYLHDTLHQLH